MSPCAFHATAYRLVVMPSQELEALYHCVYSLHYHLVIVTKYRRQVLTAAMLDRFEFLARERVEAQARPAFRLPDFSAN